MLARIALAALLPVPWIGRTHAACKLAPEDGRVVANDAVGLAWKVESNRIVVGEPFVLLLSTCPADAQVLRVDATMPEHRHGMNYRPGILSQGEGRWRVEGLLWHMAGRWEWRFDLRLPAVPERIHTLRHSVTIG